MAASLARAPYCTVTDGSTRAVAVARADPWPASPVYQEIVLAGVPLTSDVAELNGEPLIRSGGCVAVAVAPKPSAPHAAGVELVTVKPAALSVCSAITPPLIVDGVEVPLIASIFVNSVWMLSVTLTWLPPTAPEATNVMGVPLTVMVSPAAKLVASESVLAAPDNSVAPVIGAGVAALLLTTLPVAVPAVLKKSLPASTADAATSEVLASVPIAVFSAVFTLDAVSVEFAPIAKPPAGGGVALEAVS